MKLTLRKANALQNAIQEQVKEIAVTMTVSLNEFQNATVALTTARDTLVKNDVRRTALTKVLYKIRAQVGRANVESGVADLLTDAAYIDKRLGHLKSLTESKVVEDFALIEGKLEKIRTQEKSTRMYGYGDTVDTGVLTADQIEGYKAEMRDLKKQKQSINDRVLELNVRTEIELSAETVSVLTSESLV
jgi:hypothetical protein